MPRLVVCSLVSLLWVSSVGAVDYEIVDLGRVGTGESTIGYAINNRGEVAGYSKIAPEAGGTPIHAFKYSQGVLTDLGTLGGPSSYAYGINNLGHVVGDAAGNGVPQHAFVYSDGMMHDLGTLGGANSFGFSINDQGQVAGFSEGRPGTNGYRAFLYSNGVMTSLGTLGGANSYGRGINNQGQVVGFSALADNLTYKAFLYSEGQMTELTALGTGSHYAYAINNAGQIIGSYAPGGQGRAFLYTNGVVQNLGTLGGTSSGANGLNNLGDVVGESQNAAGRGRPYVYSNGIMRDVNELLPAGSFWDLYVANGINDRGQITGYGAYGGRVRAFLLSPISNDLSPVNLSFAIETKQGTVSDDFLAMDAPFVATVRVKNTGSAVPAPVTVRLYLSTDATIDSSDVLIATKSIDAVAADSETDVVFDVLRGLPSEQISAALYSGSVWIGCVVDSAETVTETDEMNNTRSVPVRLFDPVAPSHSPRLPEDSPVFFRTWFGAVRFLGSNGFAPEFWPTTDWTKPFPGEVVSYYNGTSMPEGAFSLRASSPTLDPVSRSWRSAEYVGASSDFNPFDLSPEVGTPTSLSLTTFWTFLQSIALDSTWGSYLDEYHEYF